MPCVRENPNPYERTRGFMIFMQVKIRAPFWLPDEIQQRAKPTVKQYIGISKKRSKTKNDEKSLDK